MSFTEFGGRSAAVIPEHNRLRGITRTTTRPAGLADPHPDKADTGHTHESTTGRIDAAGNSVITYAAGGTVIAFGKTFDAAPVVTANIERPVGTDPYAVYVHDVTTTGWKVVIYAGSGSEASAGDYRVYWHATPGGA